MLPRYGRIEYKTKALVLVPGGKPVESLEEEFFLHAKNTKVKKIQRQKQRYKDRNRDTKTETEIQR